MILLAKEIKETGYVYAYSTNKKELKQQGKLYGYTDSTFAVERGDAIYVFDEDNKERFKYPQKNRNAEEDLEVLLEVNNTKF